VSGNSKEELVSPEVGLRCKVLLHRSTLNRKWYIAEAEILGVDHAGKKVEVAFAGGDSRPRTISWARLRPIEWDPKRTGRKQSKWKPKVATKGNEERSEQPRWKFECPYCRKSKKESVRATGAHLEQHHRDKLAKLQSIDDPLMCGGCGRMMAKGAFDQHKCAKYRYRRTYWRPDPSSWTTRRTEMGTFVLTPILILPPDSPSMFGPRVFSGGGPGTGRRR